MKQRSVWIAAALLLLVTACSEEPAGPSGNDPSNGPSEELQKGNADGIEIRDRYVVMFRDDVEDVDAMTDELMRGKSGKVHFRYRHAIKGFAATIPAQAVEGIRHNPNVQLVEPDGIVHKSATQSNPPNWGLDRIDQRNLPLDNSYTYQNDGDGVTAYILDTGIRFDHQEFNGRAISGWDFVQNDNDASDCDGHGTHVAGTVGGTNVGVAKNVTLVAVRVLNCNGSGTWSGVIAGVDWVTANANGPSVANMSLSGGTYSPMNYAVENSIASGVVYAVAAGNNNGLACYRSPASAPNALTVGATTSSDNRSSFSNYGSCVDVFAPGSSIRSSTMNSTSSYANWSGTSMASPHVAGVAALYLAANPNATAYQVNAAIVGNATSGVVGNPGSGSPNLLLFSMIAGPPPTPTVPADPDGLSYSNLTENSVDLNWNDNSSNETGFRIEYRVSGSSNWSSTNVNANVTSTTLSGLSSGTTYDVRVFAFNSAGDSPSSGTETFTTSTPPPTPTMRVALINATSQPSNGRNWEAHFEITVLDHNDNPVPGATVSGDFGGGANGSANASTNSQGVCVVTTKCNHKANDASLTITSVTASGFIYDAGSSDTYESVNAP